MYKIYEHYIILITIYNLLMSNSIKVKIKKIIINIICDELKIEVTITHYNYLLHSAILSSCTEFN